MSSNALQSDGLSDVLAVETHSAGIWSAILLVALLGLPAGIALSPSRGIRWPLMIVVVVGCAAFAMAWSGFQYRFRQHGVEIRTLGFKLRSIPRQSIESYSIEPWSLMRGYGIRGIGNTRAYVWCNKVVHIKTSTGDVFLGHNDPERIVHDLDLVMGSSKLVAHNSQRF